MENNPYRFVKVEDFFRNYEDWSKLDTVTTWKLDNDPKSDKYQTISLVFGQANCTLLIQIMGRHSFRVRFNPGKHKIEDYSSNNTRAVVLNTYTELKKVVEKNNFNIRCTEKQSEIIVTTEYNGQNFLRMNIQRSPFTMAVYNEESNYSKICTEPVWQMAYPSIYYEQITKDGDYNIIQAVYSPCSAKYLGFGEQGGKSLFKSTCQLNYFNYDNMCYRQVYNKGPFEEREPMYHSDPSFIAFNPISGCDSIYGVFIDNPSQVCMDLTYSNSTTYMFGVRFGDLDYYVTIGSCVADITINYSTLIGTSRLKPRYVLGYHQGCYGYESRSALEYVVKKYRDYQIPLDGLHVDVDIQYKYQTFTIDENKFPNPKEMFQNLRNLGIKCSTNITPIISNQDPNYKVYREGINNNYFIKDVRTNNGNLSLHQDYSDGHEYIFEYNNYNPNQPFVGEVYYGDDNGVPRGTTGHYPDLGRKEVRLWWGKQYQYLFDMGLEMVWQDMTTPAIRNTRGDMKGFPFNLKLSDDFMSTEQVKQTEAIKMWNLYSYNLHKATFHGLNKLQGRQDKRNFIIGRGSLSGMHRYAGLWTGDNCSCWHFLQMNISQVLAQGLCGISICGQDIGGFEAYLDWEKWADPELLIRWTIAGAFLPWFRNHYNHKNNRKYFQEPWAYHELNHHDYIYQCVLPVCKYYIELRYRLLQLFYDALFENVLTGLPICRAMVIIEKYDQTLYTDKISFLDNQFFVRHDLLIAPVIYPSTAGGGERDVYLPLKSDWYLFMNNCRPLQKKILGGTTVRFDANINNDPNHIPFIVPMFVRSGAIIPTIELEQYVGERNANKQANPITFNIYPGNEGTYTTYLDDGISVKSAPKNIYRDVQQQKGSVETRANDEYRAVKIDHVLINQIRTINIKRIVDNYTPVYEKYFFIALLHDPMESDGKSSPIQNIQIQYDKEFFKDPQCKLIPDGSTKEANLLNNATTNAYYYNKDINVTFIKVFEERDTKQIQVLVSYKK